ncbi:hypothetical protein [Azoarcus taiwanensis]|uniref:N-acetyltransferase domain-containing protein n=1 Tax=Azoarcus taiwanensis TaxID=666964 RepID=A0A972F5R8_9RHOO|nr:hypothetical protein [Azoarcus taiwanensis]NMG01819.1 hypothetical protein [Azoarcus taiwanensis]
MGPGEFLRFAARRVLRYQSHVVFGHDLADLPPPEWPVGFEPLLLHCNEELPETVVADLVAAAPSNQAYIDDIRQGSAIGLVAYHKGTLAHFAFVMKGSPTLRMLGFNADTALLGNARTFRRFRGRGLQTQSIRARLIAAKHAGFASAVSETALDNHASQKALERAGLARLGTVRFVVALNRLILRHKSFGKPTLSITLL